MIRLAYVINNLNIGGAEKLLLTTTKRLDKKKYHITVCSMLQGGDLISEFESHGIRVYCLNMRSNKDIRGFFKLYRLFKTKSIDIVHTHLIEADVYGRFAAICAGVPVILSTDHGVDGWRLKRRRLKTRLRLFLNRIAANHSQGIIAVSTAVRNHLVNAEKIDSARVYLIRNGIELPKKNHFSTPMNGRLARIGCVARLSPEKGVDHLLRAFALAQQENPDLELQIAGDGPQRPALEQLVCKLNLASKVFFHGWIPDVRAFLNQIDFFVLPSLQEGLPLALLEAMAEHKPVVATRVGGVPEVIEDGISGILVEPADVTALSQGILALAKNPALRQAMAKMAYEKMAQRFDIDSSIQELQRLYESLLQAKNPTL